VSEGSEAVSPTAHYTGYVWARNGLSHPVLRTVEGRMLYDGLRPLMGVSQRLLGTSLEPFLLARHRALDGLLDAAIEAGEVGQVIEVASGLSPRGWRFATRYGPRITYIETDLPGMTARKRAAMARIGSLGEHHRVEELDALRASGAGSLAALSASLDPEQGLAIITEGLLNYLPHRALTTMWQRFATTLHGFPQGRYYSDLHVGDLQTAYMRGFRLGLSGFVRGRVDLHFDSATAAEEALHAAGFELATVRRADRVVPDAGAGASVVHIIEASTRLRHQPDDHSHPVQ
jgi:O-methyltransferase involved in polyketide biosynthesis